MSLTSLEDAQDLARRTVQEAESDLYIFGERAAFLRELVGYLVNRKQ